MTPTPTPTPTPTDAIVTFGTHKINKELVADYAQAPPYRFLRLHLDVPIDQDADWHALQNAFNNVDGPDLAAAHTTVVKLVKGKPSETGPARKVIDAAFESTGPSSKRAEPSSS